MNAITWEQLTEAEQEALKAMPVSFAVARNSELWEIWEKHKPVIPSLLEKGLIRPTVVSYKTIDAGRAVLTEADRAKAQPVAISAREFVEQGYAAKVAAGECVVYLDTYLKVKSCEKTGAVYTAFLVDTSEYRQDKFRYFYADQKLIVKYPSDIEIALRQETPQPAPDAGEAEILVDFLEYGDRSHTTKAQATDAAHSLLTRITDLEAELLASRKREAALREALKPFAETWENYINDSSDEDFLQWYCGESDDENVTEMHKQAAAALQAAGESEE